MAAFINLTSKIFDRLTVLYRLPNDRYNRTVWLCLCTCGTKRAIAGAHLRYGHTRSCGCFYKDSRATCNLIHGAKSGNKTWPEYQIWRAMIQRCYLKTAESYPLYAGRGISVCKRWRDSFQNFIADVGRRPSRVHTLDRENNAGNYEPSNVKWVTRIEQANNRRNVRRIKIGKVTKTIRGWADFTGIPIKSLQCRINRGWTGEKILSPIPQK